MSAHMCDSGLNDKKTNVFSLFSDIAGKTNKPWQQVFTAGHTQNSQWDLTKMQFCNFIIIYLCYERP